MAVQARTRDPLFIVGAISRFVRVISARAREPFKAIARKSVRAKTHAVVK